MSHDLARARHMTVYPRALLQIIFIRALASSTAGFLGPGASTNQSVATLFAPEIKWDEHVGSGG